MTHKLEPAVGERDMTGYSVGHDGVRFQHNGDPYDKWQEAVTRVSSPKLAPIGATHVLMASLPIRFDDGGAYRAGDFRHDSLSHAVNDAKPGCDLVALLHGTLDTVGADSTLPTTVRAKR